MLYDALIDPYNGTILYDSLLKTAYAIDHALLLDDHGTLISVDCNGKKAGQLTGVTSLLLWSPGSKFFTVYQGEQKMLIDNTCTVLVDDLNSGHFDGTYFIHCGEDGGLLIRNLVTGVEASYPDIKDNLGSVECLESSILSCDKDGNWHLTDYSGNELTFDAGRDYIQTLEDIKSCETYIKFRDNSTIDEGGDENRELVLYDQAGKEILRWKSGDSEANMDPAALFLSKERIVWLDRKGNSTRGRLTSLDGTDIVPPDRYYMISYAVKGTDCLAGGYLEDGKEKKEIFDLDGNIIVSDIDDIYVFDGYRCVIKKDGVLGLIDMEGNWLYQEKP